MQKATAFRLWLSAAIVRWAARTRMLFRVFRCRGSLLRVTALRVSFARILRSPQKIPRMNLPSSPLPILCVANTAGPPGSVPSGMVSSSISGLSRELSCARIRLRILRATVGYRPDSRLSNRRSRRCRLSEGAMSITRLCGWRLYPGSSSRLHTTASLQKPTIR